MFTGEITNWSEVGGDDGEIVLVGREAGSGTRDGFESIVDVKDSEETVKDGSYEVQRPFVFVTNDSVTLSAQAQAFFDFATSTDAADLIRTAGAVPVNE